MIADEIRLLRFFPHLVDECHVTRFRTVTDVTRSRIREERIALDAVNDGYVTVEFREIGFEVFEGLRARVTAGKGEHSRERDEGEQDFLHVLFLLVKIRRTVPIRSRGPVMSGQGRQRSKFLRIGKCLGCIGV